MRKASTRRSNPSATPSVTRWPSAVGLYKSELIHHEGPWRDQDQVEAATASSMLWFNTERTHAAIDDLTLIEAEQVDYSRSQPLERAG
ncbi:hypothetical protein [Cellulomonas cellasea]|uniref:Transposase InsO family protein n=1 Tax=Cellulomonas cellasea TaxID=43670 RepID=A0A7W4UH69_9CELL|nr:hypothetical protein [Cellulomonas cellasea]MBB2924106.1 transposase InsO family protein [Cellulomonas cellasea]